MATISAEQQKMDMEGQWPLCNDYYLSRATKELKVSYIIRLVIIKHVLVKELLILQVQTYDIKPW